MEHYGIDVILSVGYRVKSHRGIEFRAWANDVLHRYMTKGYAANERRLRELGQTMSIVARLPEGACLSAKCLTSFRATPVRSTCSTTTTIRPSMLAESRPQEKELMISLVMNFLVA